MSTVAEKTYALFPDPNNAKIVRELEQAGARIFRFPLVETRKIALTDDQKNWIANVQDFDWIIFPDVLAVEFFLATLEETKTDLFDLDAIRVCAFGEIVSDQLRFVQLHADVIPNTLDAAATLSALQSYIAHDEFEHLKFLLPAAVGQKIELKNELVKLKATVNELPLYEINLPDSAEITKLKTLLTNGAIDEFIISAPKDLIALKYIFKSEMLNEILADTKIYALDAQAFQTIRENLLKCAGFFPRQEN